MRSLLIAGLVLAASAHADEMFLKNGTTEIRLQEATCTDARIIAMAAMQNLLMPMKSGHVLFAGRHIPLCWGVLNPETLILIDAEGDGGVAPAAAFQRSPGV